MDPQEGNPQKLKFQGVVFSVQPRTTVWRYVSQYRTHKCIGYNLLLRGSICDVEGDFVVAVSEKQYQKLLCEIGDAIVGTGWSAKYPEREFATLYRAGGLKVVFKAEKQAVGGDPPWIGLPPDVETYNRRGARQLARASWNSNSKCFCCYWAALANVTIEYEFGVQQKYRFESFCYGPKNCPFYKMGRPRAVPYKGRDTYYDNGMLDDMCTEHREDDE